MPSWPWRRGKNGGIGVRTRRGSGAGRGCCALDPRLCRSSRLWTLVRAFWWPDWGKRRPKRRTMPPRVCKKWLELDWHFVFDPQMIKIWIHRWNEKSNPCDFLRVSFFVGGIRQQPTRQAWTQSKMNFTFKCNNWHMNVSAWRKKNQRDRSIRKRFSLSANTWEKGRRNMNRAWRKKNQRDRSICSRFSLSWKTWGKGKGRRRKRHQRVSAWRKRHQRDMRLHCRCNKFSLSAKTWEKGRRKVNVKGWRRDRQSHCNCKNFSFSAQNWTRKSSSSTVSWRQLTLFSSRWWTNSGMYPRKVMPKMPLSQTARGSCARRWQKLLVYPLTQLAVASWGRLSSRRRKFLLRKWNWILQTLWEYFLFHHWMIEWIRLSNQDFENVLEHYRK